MSQIIIHLFIVCVHFHKYNAGNTAGRIVVSVLVEEDSNYKALSTKNIAVTLTNKSSLTVKPPAAKENLVCTGKPQELVFAGLVDHGTFYYAIGSNDKLAPTGNWNTTIPEGIEAKTYYVWYKVLGDSTHTDIEPRVLKVRIKEKQVTNVSVSYITHIQNLGWNQGYVNNGEVSGTSAKSYRLEAIRIKLSGNANLGVQYTTHCQDYGWLAWSANDEINGTQGESKRLEAIMINLTGADKDKYDIYYRVHAQNIGWMGWAKNGSPAGTAGYAYRLEAIQIQVVRKGVSYNAQTRGITSAVADAYRDKNKGAAPQVANSDIPNLSYRTHVQNVGWQAWKTNGGFSGTSGRSLRLEGINVKLSNKDYTGGIRYKTHIQNIGWEKNWRVDGEMSGTSGRSLRLEAIEIELYGEMAKHYDIYYRVHAQDVGWMGWAANGSNAGTAGYARRLEGIQIVLVPKGSAAPLANYGNITSVTSKPYLSR